MSNDGGDFISGTVADKAFFDAILDTVDDQAHSTTNPAVKPKATTDEVVAARGSKATLDARLDVSIEEDGTLKSQASLVAASTYQAGLGGRNVAQNGDLADWTAGGALAPDTFTLTGAAATIARTGIAQVDTFHFGTGSGFAAKVTRAGTNWKLTQDVISAADFTKYVNVKSQKVGVAVKGKTSIGSLLRIVVDDGVTTTASSYHTGGGAEEHLSVVHTISASATKLSVYVEGTGSNGDAYVGGFNIVFADLAPSDWSPLSIIGDASATSKGLLTIVAQPVVGVKNFTSAPIGLNSWLFARSTGDVTKNNSTVLADVTGLTFAIGANETWIYLFLLHGFSGTTPDMKLALTFPAAVTAVRYGFVGAGAPNAGGGSTSTPGTGLFYGTSALEESIWMFGIVRNGTNGGNVQLQMAQQTADVSNTIIRADSNVIAIRVA